MPKRLKKVYALEACLDGVSVSHELCLTRKYAEMRRRYLKKWYGGSGKTYRVVTFLRYEAGESELRER